MKNISKIRIVVFAIFLITYLAGIFTILHQGDQSLLVLCAFVCFFSLCFYIYFHSVTSLF